MLIGHYSQVNASTLLICGLTFINSRLELIWLEFGAICALNLDQIRQIVLLLIFYLSPVLLYNV